MILSISLRYLGALLASVLALGLTLSGIGVSQDPVRPEPTGQHVPRGTVVMWSGKLSDLSPAWALCDGSNSTPDLRDRFVVGAGATHAVDARGGASGHIHSATAGSATDRRWVDDHSSGNDHWVSGENHTHSFTTSSSSHMPPFHALYFVMKR